MPIPKERKELCCGTHADCEIFIREHESPDDLEIVPLPRPGPSYGVFRKRKERNRTIRTPISRETRGTFRVQGVSRDPMRVLIVTLEPGDVISFRPKGTQQKVEVPIGSVYGFARFAAARAIASAKKPNRKKKPSKRRK